MKLGKWMALVCTVSVPVFGCGGPAADQPAASPPPPPPAPAPAEPQPAPPMASPEQRPAGEPAPAPRVVQVTIQPRSSSKASGTATLTEVDGGVKVAVQVSGAPPGERGLHIHQKADCSAPDATSAGDHFSPEGHPHGLPEAPKKHLGDLGNITIGADGTGTKEITVQGANLKPGDPMSFIGRAIMLHAKQDTGGQPAGNAGARIGCGEITAGEPATLSAKIEAKSGSKLSGSAEFTSVPGGVRIALSVQNPTDGEHAVHIHEKGDCSAPDATSAGDHFNPEDHPHGLPPGERRHLGDLGNMTIKGGTGRLEITVQGASLRPDDPKSFLGRALIVHAQKDTGAQPAGNAGSRIGCAVVRQL